MNIGLVILAVYIAVLLGIALYASKKDKKNIKDFATGGGLGIFILTLTFSATYHSAYAFMGAGGFAYKTASAGGATDYGQFFRASSSGFGDGAFGIWVNATVIYPCRTTPLTSINRKQ